MNSIILFYSFLQLHLLNQQEPGVILFRSETMQFRVSLDPNFFQSLHIKITPAMENQMPWNQEELQVPNKLQVTL